MLDKTDFDKLSLVYQKTNRLLSGNERIVVTQPQIQSQSVAFAIPHKNLICINYKEIIYKLQENKIDTDDKTVFTLTKGLNYHELAHLLFTDYSLEDLKNAFYNDLSHKGIQFKKFHEIVNMIEDCRIESLFCELYNASTNYFVNSFSKLILAVDVSKQDPDSEFLVSLAIYGRKFLYKLKSFQIAAKNFRQHAFNVLDNNRQTKLLHVEKLLDRFLIEPKKANRLTLATQITELLFYSLGNSAQNSLEKISSSTNSISSQGYKRGKANRNKKVAKKLEKALGKIKTQNPNAEQLGKTPNELKEELQEEVKELVDNSKQMMKDFKTDMKNINKLTDKSCDGEAFMATSSHRLSAKRVEKILRQLRSGLFTSTETYKKRGTLDMKSAIRAQKNKTLNAFKKTKLNRINHGKLGVVILLDSSGSITNSEFREEMKASWVLTQALEKLGNKVEIIEFSSTFRTLKKFNNNGDWIRKFGSQTKVLEPLQQAKSDLLKLKQTDNIDNLFVILISDGAYDDKEKVHDELKNIHKSGIETLWILAKNADNYFYNRHARFIEERNQKIGKNFKWFFTINNLKDLELKLFGIIKMIEKSILKKINNKIFYT